MTKRPGRWLVTLHGRSAVAAYVLIAAVTAGSVYDGVTGANVLLVPSLAGLAVLVILLVTNRPRRH